MAIVLIRTTPLTRMSNRPMAQTGLRRQHYGETFHFHSRECPVKIVFLESSPEFSICGVRHASVCVPILPVLIDIID